MKSGKRSIAEQMAARISTKVIPILFILSLAAAGVASIRSAAAHDDQNTEYWSLWPAVSDGGRYLAFVSTLPDPSQADWNGLANIYLLDVRSQSTSLISLNSRLQESNGWSYQPAIAADGQTIVFTSLASNLAGPYQTADTNGMADIFLHSRQFRTTERISVNARGEQANGWSQQPAISGDGRWIVYSSTASNLSSSDTNPGSDIYLYNQESKRVRLISPPSLNETVEYTHPAISLDGRFVVFLVQHHPAYETVPGGDILLFDRLTSQTALVPHPSREARLTSPAITPAISATGERIAYAAEEDGGISVYVYDRQIDETRRVAIISTDRALPPLEASLGISADGRLLAYPSWTTSRKGEIAIANLDNGQTQEFPFANSLPDSFQQNGWLAFSPDGGFLVRPGNTAQTAELQSAGFEILANSDASSSSAPAVLSGWVSDGAGHPLAGIEIAGQNQAPVETRIDGSFAFAAPSASEILLRPQQKGFTFIPQQRKIVLDGQDNQSSSNANRYGLAFTAVPSGLVEAARKDLNMPYSLDRGCPSPLEPCGGPYYGFFSGDCTDLVMDAYREGLQFDIEQALDWDFRTHPDHYYRWHSGRDSHDMWRYFAYTGQLLDSAEPYQPGDIVFFDWENDGEIDHASLISAVNDRGQPTRMLDATGVTSDNPSGLAAELDWKPFHNRQNLGHARWLGYTAPSRPEAGSGALSLLVALDSPAAELEILDGTGRLTSPAQSDIPGSAFWRRAASQVIHLSSSIDGGDFLIRISGPAGMPYYLGIQAIQDGVILKSRYDQGVIDLTGSLNLAVTVGAGAEPAIQINLSQQ